MQEIWEGILVSNVDLEVTALKNIHPSIDENYALKFKPGKKIIVFSGDTTYCPALASFAAGADYLIHEVIYGPAIVEMVKRVPNASKLKASILSHHTLSEDVVRIAKAAIIIQTKANKQQ